LGASFYFSLGGGATNGGTDGSEAAGGAGGGGNTGVDACAYAGGSGATCGQLMTTERGWDRSMKDYAGK